MIWLENRILCASRLEKKEWPCQLLNCKEGKSQTSRTAERDVDLQEGDEDVYILAFRKNIWMLLDNQDPEQSIPGMVATVESHSSGVE